MPGRRWALIVATGGLSRGRSTWAVAWLKPRVGLAMTKGDGIWRGLALV